jgi:hypothetical protein
LSRPESRKALKREPLAFFVDPKFLVAHREVWFPVNMLCAQCDATKAEGNIVFRGDAQNAAGYVLFDLGQLRCTAADIPEKLGLSMDRKHRIRHNEQAKIFAVSKSKKNPIAGLRSLT